MNIKIGQYINGNSILHKMDPRIKLISMFFLIVTIFLVPVKLDIVYIIWVISLFIFSVLLIFLSGVPIGKVFSGLKAVVFLLTFTFIIQLFTIRPVGETVLLDVPMEISFITGGLFIGLTFLYHYLKSKIKFRTIWFFIYVFLIFFIQYLVFKYISTSPSFIYQFKVYPSGLIRAGFIFLRIVSVMIIASLLTFTTSTIELNDGLESLMKPLRLIKVPTYVFSMMISLTLRSIPTLLEETEKILKAQTSRGADFNESKFKDKLRQIIALLIPVFVISFNRADDLSNAMEARGYIIGEERTKIDIYKIKFTDYLALITIGLIFISLLVVRIAL